MTYHRIAPVAWLPALGVRFTGALLHGRATVQNRERAALEAQLEEEVGASGSVK